MRVLTIESDTSLRSGGPRMQFEIARGLAARGHDVELLHGAEGEFLAEYAAFCSHVERVRGRSDDALRRPRATVRVAPTAAAIARRRPDVIYVNGLRHLPHTALACLRRSVPVVSHLHVFPPRKPRLRDVAGTRSVSRFIAVSEAVAERFAAVGVPRRSITVVHNGVDPDRYVDEGPEARGAARRELGVPDDAYVVAFLGRLDRVKNLETLMRAYGALGLDGAGGRLLLVGAPRTHATSDAAGGYVERLKAVAPEGTMFLPPRVDVRPLYQAVDVVVLPSREEPFGLIAIEAMSSGRPVAAADVDGPREILGGAFDGHLFAPDDVDGLTRRLAGLRDWRTETPDLAARGRQLVLDRFTLDRTVAEVEAVLDGAVRVRSRAGVRTRTFAAQGRRR